MHRIHRTSCRERTPTDGTDVHRCRRVWHPCHTHAAKFCGFCGFRGNKAHPKHLCKSVKSVGGKRFPQNARNTRKLLAEKNLPQMTQMSTDVGGYGIPAIPTLPNSVFCWRTAHSKHLCKSVKSVGEKIFPQNARNAQKLLAEKSLPQMARMFTDVGGYGIPAIPTLPNSVYSVNSVGEQRTISICAHLCHLWEALLSRRFCEFCGRISHSKRREYGKMPYPPKEKSVGGHLCRRFCEFGVFCGRISHSRRRGYGKMPYPPKEESAGGHLIKL